MHHHLGGMHAVETFLIIVVLMGTTNLLAMKYKDSSSLAASWCNLFGLS